MRRRTQLGWLTIAEGYGRAQTSVPFISSGVVSRPATSGAPSLSIPVVPSIERPGVRRSLVTFARYSCLRSPVIRRLEDERPVALDDLAIEFETRILAYIDDHVSPIHTRATPTEAPIYLGIDTHTQYAQGASVESEHSSQNGDCDY